MFMSAKLYIFSDIAHTTANIHQYFLFLKKNITFASKAQVSFMQRIILNRNIMDKKTLEFVTYCVSKLSSLLNLPQREVYRRLLKSGILYGYIVPSYDVLHTFGSHYLMDDLIDYMKEKGELPK